MNQNQQDFYQAMRKGIDGFLKSDKAENYKWTSYLLLVPDFFHLLIKLSLDPRVSIKDKALLGVAIAYFFSPLDLIPEALMGPIGLIDDLAVAAYALNRILSNAGEELIREHWAGDEDVIVKIKEVVSKADEMLGSGIVAKIKKMMSMK